MKTMTPRDETAPPPPPKMHRATRAKLIAKLEEDLALLRAIRQWAEQERREIAAHLGLPQAQPPKPPARRRRGKRGGRKPAAINPSSLSVAQTQARLSAARPTDQPQPRSRACGTQRR